MKLSFLITSFSLLCIFQTAYGQNQINQGSILEQSKEKIIIREKFKGTAYTLNNNFNTEDFILKDSTTNTRITLSKSWLYNHVNEVQITEENYLSVETPNSILLIKDEQLVDEILIAIKKKFPRPFRPKKLQLKPSSNNQRGGKLKSNDRR